MSTGLDELRAALGLLEPKIEEFEARIREAEASSDPADPMLEALRLNLLLLRQERDRLREQLRQPGR